MYLWNMILAVKEDDVQLVVLREQEKARNGLSVILMLYD